MHDSQVALSHTQSVMESHVWWHMGVCDGGCVYVCVRGVNKIALVVLSHCEVEIRRNGVGGGITLPGTHRAV